jgi:LPS-assembly protein
LRSPALPTLEKTFTPPKWMGREAKHSIEPRAFYRYSTGVNDFQSTIRFDDIEILSNTNEVEYSLANRIWTKDRSGQVWDYLALELRQKRFFDPTFGGALVAGQRNVLTSSADLTGYTFLTLPAGILPLFPRSNFARGLLSAWNGGLITIRFAIG